MSDDASPLRRLTRMDTDGVPALVQGLSFDPSSSLFFVRYFDGTTTTIRAPIRVNAIGCLLQNPSNEEWESVERDAIDKYINMQELKHSLAFGYNP